MSVVGMSALRLLLVTFGIALTGWGAYGTYASFHGGEIEALSAHIRAGDRFSPEVMKYIEHGFEDIVATPVPDPKLVRDLAIFRLRQADMEVAAGIYAGGPALPRAERAVRSALSLSPTDGFLWFALAWLTKTRDGFSDDALRELTMSYATAPHEGWVAAHRNAMAVPLIAVLPKDLRGQVLGEFANLVSANYMASATDILTGSGWGERGALLDSLRDLPMPKRLQFARELDARNIDLQVPGIDARSLRRRH